MKKAKVSKVHVVGFLCIVPYLLFNIYLLKYNRVRPELDLFEKRVYSNSSYSKTKATAERRPQKVTLASISCPINETTNVTLPVAPHFIIVGAQKSGTSALATYLGYHPHILPSIKFETHFFDWNFAVSPQTLKNSSYWAGYNASSEEELLCKIRSKYIQNNFNITHLLSEEGSMFAFEKTPNYMFLPSVPELVHKVCPWQPKIIILLRNPVERAYSHFIMDRRTGDAQGHFERYIRNELRVMKLVGLTKLVLPASLDNLTTFPPPPKLNQSQRDLAHWQVYRRIHMRNYLQRGLYSHQIERWTTYFPLGKSLMVINSDRLHRETQQVVAEVLDFLQVPGSRRLKMTLPPEGVAAISSYDSMPKTIHSFLEQFFQPYNAELSSVLGQEWTDVWLPKHINKTEEKRSIF